MQNHLRQAVENAVLVALLRFVTIGTAVIQADDCARTAHLKLYQLVCTRPLSAGALVSTRKFSDTPSAAPVAGVVEIATVSGGYRVINDDELLALLADKPAVLIRTGPHAEELVFANPEDQKKLLAN